MPNDPNNDDKTIRPQHGEGYSAAIRKPFERGTPNEPHGHVEQPRNEHGENYRKGGKRGGPRGV